MAVEDADVVQSGGTRDHGEEAVRREEKVRSDAGSWDRLGNRVHRGCRQQLGEIIENGFVFDFGEIYVSGGGGGDTFMGPSSAR